MIGLIFPVAVGLVTLIIQRENSSNAASDIKVYYKEALVYQIGASSIALSMILSGQLIWPAHFLIKKLGFFTSSEYFKIAITLVHLIWLLINFFALWHFLQTSLSFVVPSDRSLLRRRFAASVSIPNDISQRLMNARYANAGQFILGESSMGIVDDGQPSLFFGSDLGEWGEIEIQLPKGSNAVLIDVWMRPLKWAIRNWLKRCQKQNDDALHGHSGPTLVFLPDWRRPMPEDGIICRRRHGVPLCSLERFLIRRSFRFGKERP